MYTGPVEAGTTIVTSVALAAARTVVEQQAQYNETIQQKRAERNVESAKDSSAESAGFSDTAKNSKSQDASGSGSGSVGQAGFTGGSPQSANPSRGSQVDLQI